MNLLTFDIEEWYIEKRFGTGSYQKYEEYEEVLDKILALLDETETKATFFCLGKIATDFPEIIKKIDSHGHEIGCHSNLHKWVNKMTTKEFNEDTCEAISALENIIGKKVVSYRSPAFSITEKNKWAFEILKENGIENDASIFPGVRDFGGFTGFPVQKPCVINYNGIRINEFPIPLFNLPLINKQLAFSGGGYFRLLPLSFIKRLLSKSDYNMCYFHIEDLLLQKSPFMTRKEFETYFKEDGGFLKRLSRYFKSNIGRERAMSGLEDLVGDYNFVSVSEYGARGGIFEEITI